MSIEHESNLCQSCGYPSYAGHSSVCATKKKTTESAPEIDVGVEIGTKEKKLESLLSVEDAKEFGRIVESIGGVEKLFDPKNKFLHTTDNLSFADILRSGKILTDEVTPGGAQRTPGASFTDGNFPEAASFQLLYDNIPGGGREKRLNSEKYAEAMGGSHAERFIRYFLENHLDDAKEYLGQLAKKIPDDKLASIGLSSDRRIETREQALAIAKFFTPKGKGDFGVTVVYDASKQDQLGIEDRGTVGLQKFFEKRSYKQGGVPISEASAVLVPASRVEEMRKTLDERGLGHVDVRSTEELEARLLVEKAEEHGGVKRHLRDYLGLKEGDVERIEFLTVKDLPKNYQAQYEALDDERLGEVTIAVVPDDLWVKGSQPSESSAERQLVTIKQSYFETREDNDEIAWLSHELTHCQKFLDSESPDEYKDDMQKPAFGDLRSEYTYTNNLVEQAAFTRQFQFLKERGKSREDVLAMLGEYYKEYYFPFFNRLLDQVYVHLQS